MPIINFENEMPVTTIPAVSDKFIHIVNRKGDLFLTKVVAYHIEGQRAIPVYHPEPPASLGHTVEVQEVQEFWNQSTAFGVSARCAENVARKLRGEKVDE
ncbi:hypothetical protein CXB77_06020 (plasmid) [Chromatium okenii]|jgi:hypothetical protein|uniref:Uncharacterized protein n=2 Tax=Chromatium okenii TaxID=61644 RepID=A0A2S7XSZ0_9GAMM|nr:hypothetical protein CXB77_06020 [Chromatium okenii]